MPYDPKAIAVTILTNVAIISVLTNLTREDQHSYLWQIVADVVAKEYQDTSSEISVPNISSLTDSVLLIVAAAMKQSPTRV